MTKKYNIFQEKHIPLIKGLMRIAFSKGESQISSPFDNMDNISLSECRNYINEIEKNTDQD